MPESETDAWGGNFGGLGKAVKPVGLNFPGHGEKASVLEFGGHAFTGDGVFELKAPFCSEAQAGDGGVGDDG